ncbi:Flp family type IVb pilin [Nereida sp. MMG025]|uniref:Flp family type IVb pilin n=1 Tax=Nereida sp. MMG025 TaxID=2909981 RepID=UPI001F46E8E2|nr:hypothetical protein [Nereida sp. MMG025]MCF6445006.1 hypothetical protein [Nereida sp. MMG025]
MKFVNMIKNFRKDEDGAVTVDWVVLTAAIVGLGLAIMFSVGNGTEALANKISSKLSTQTLGYK